MGTTKQGKDEMSSRVVITPPNFQTAEFLVKGTAPLVVHRFSEKVKEILRRKMEEGRPSGNKKNREPKSTEEAFHDARYISKEGWDGFNASAIRNAMISVCRLVNFKMTVAKLSVFVEPDGWDKFEPQIPLIRIRDCEPVLQTDIGKTETKVAYVTVRPAYHNWSARLKIRWDADQFTLADVTNLLYRVGLQAGICEGRPDSKNSAGMGWGTFTIVNQ